MTFGQMPLANGFLDPSEFCDEYFFELAPVFCESCGSFQILEQPDPKSMFHGVYPFFTRSSKRMSDHFANFADSVAPQVRGAPGESLILEIGSNDGVMLERFSAMGYRHLGIEPSANVASEAIRHGVQTLVEFFSTELAGRIRAEFGPADAIVAANVICHIPDILDLAKAIETLLADDGLFVFEEPYLGDMIAKTSYDQIYDEHVFVFSVRSVRNIFSKVGLELIDVTPQTTHGGSMRYSVARKGRRAVGPSVARQLQYETNLGLERPETYDAFRLRCETSRHDLRRLLRRLHAEGKRVMGYAATSKSTTVLNYCDIAPEWISCIVDSTPIKQGKYTPGIHIPVRPDTEFRNSFPDYAVLFAWNHAEEIHSKEAGFVKHGGRWIYFVPEVGIIE